MTTAGGNINSTKLVVQAYLNMTQDTTQGIISQQSININCEKNTNACQTCIKTAKLYNIGEGDYSSACPACFCSVENIKMNNIITLNLDAFTSINAEDNFKTQIKNSLTQNAYKTGTTIFGSDNSDKMTSLVDTSAEMYSEMSSTDFQKTLQQLKNFQVININNPNTSLINVDIDLTVEFLSKIIQQNATTSSILLKYDQNIIQLTTQIIEGGLTVIISWMVTLFIIAILVAFFIFGANIIMDVFMLYSMT